MGLTRVELASRVRSRTASLDADVLLDNDELYLCINDGIAAFAEERDWPWLEATATISLVAGTAAYSLPTGFTRFHTVALDGQELAAIDPSELLRYSTTIAGVPRRYALIGSQVYLSATPAEAGTLAIYYQREEAFLDDDTDQTYAPRRAASLMTTFAAIYASIRIRDEKLTAQLYKLKDEEIRRLYDAVSRSSVGPSIQTRDDNRA